MKVLGVRCSNNDCTFCLVSGSKKTPSVELLPNVKFPKGFNKAETLKWFSQELETIFNDNEIDSVAIKGAETMVKRSNNLTSRIQNEAVIYLVSAKSGVLNVDTKVKATIAKDLGLKGRAKSLETELDKSVIEDYDAYPTKAQEAILVGWSSLI